MSAERRHFSRIAFAGQAQLVTVEQRLPVQVLECPVPFPELVYYQLWHERTHQSAAGRWLRERVKSVGAALRS